MHPLSQINATVSSQHWLLFRVRVKRKKNHLHLKVQIKGISLKQILIIGIRKKMIEESLMVDRDHKDPRIGLEKRGKKSIQQTSSNKEICVEKKNDRQ